MIWCVIAAQSSCLLVDPLSSSSSLLLISSSKKESHQLVYNRCAGWLHADTDALSVQNNLTCIAIDSVCNASTNTEYMLQNSLAPQEGWSERIWWWCHLQHKTKSRCHSPVSEQRLSPTSQGTIYYTNTNTDSHIFLPLLFNWNLIWFMILWL